MYINKFPLTFAPWSNWSMHYMSPPVDIRIHHGVRMHIVTKFPPIIAAISSEILNKIKK
jgi:hypothetical protein